MVRLRYVGFGYVVRLRYVGYVVRLRYVGYVVKIWVRGRLRYVGYVVRLRYVKLKIATYPPFFLLETKNGRHCYINSYIIYVMASKKNKKTHFLTGTCGYVVLGYDMFGLVGLVW